LAIKHHPESPQSFRTFTLQAADSSDTECALKQTQRLGFFASDHNYQAEGIEFVMPSFSISKSFQNISLFVSFVLEVSGL
jgi:hypothetical protein